MNRVAPNLHLREDTLLGQVFTLLARVSTTDSQIKPRLAELQRTGKPPDLARFLGTHDIMIICDRSGSIAKQAVTPQDTRAQREAATALPIDSVSGFMALTSNRAKPIGRL